MMHSLNTCGLCPLARLYQHGLLGSKLIGAHMIHLIENEIKLLRQPDCNNSPCPSPDLKLASGFALVSDLLAHGLNVCIGTDGVLIVTIAWGSIKS
ncbi:5-methylthioadenosine/S-adenosylhomocysteine deaminase [Nitrosomonas sp. Nm34]|nr:5-methylthioadenosine/S-adenosylhomocysteine deaminase [Nitrosomonas sp. Nm34]